MKIKTIFFLTICSFLFSGLYSPENQKKPNILCIFVDDLGYGDLSVQGATDLQTPNIDNISAQGLTFTRFYANSTVCSPSRASLLTGRYPDMVGVPGVIRQNKENSWGHLSKQAVLLPEVLNSAGYHTTIIGKWHLGLESPNTPNERGFDLFKGFLGDMMDDYYDHRRGGINWMRENGKEIDPKGHATDIFTDWAVQYLKDRKKEKNPFFLYLAYNAPHFPIQPPEEWLKKVREREKGISEDRAKNVAFIEHLDHAVGRVMNTLKQTGLDKNTLVVFTSDNGGSLRHTQSNGKLRGGKQDMYEGGIRVPMFVMWKDKIIAGSKTENLALLMDLFPTFCEIAGAPFDHEIDGKSILPTVLGKEQTTDDRYVYWVRREGGGRYGGQAYYAAGYKDSKILQNTPFEPVQYFKLDKDPYEQNDMSGQPDDTYRALRKELQEHIRKAGSVPWNSEQ